MDYNRELSKRRAIQALRELKRLQRERIAREEAAAKEAQSRPETGIDYEMKEIFATAAHLAADMGIAFEIPEEWR